MPCNDYECTYNPSFFTDDICPRLLIKHALISSWDITCYHKAVDRDYRSTLVRKRSTTFDDQRRTLRVVLSDDDVGMGVLSGISNEGPSTPANSARP